MTWVGGIFAVLALVLLGGIAWYERSRPPSQIVALVATLAALAVAGRVAFAPIPNVLPSTDIILVAGYALGGGPGFAVGALTGLVSNFWLGQGPWTPWQMAGWGMVGVLGAALAKSTGGEIRRLPLALFCAFAGLAYGALLDFHTMVTYGGEQSLDRYLALSARGIPFNVAHAAGNFVLALAAGPALIRMLRRYRARFEFEWGGAGATVRAGARGAAAAGCVAALLIAAGDPAGQDARAAKAAAKGPDAAVSYLRAAQNSDGGFGSEPGTESSPAMTGWAVLGLESAGVNPHEVRSGGKTPIGYLRSTVAEITTTGDIERTILVLEAAGVDSRAFGGKDLVTRLQSRRGGDGSWGRQVNPTAFGVMALEAASVTAANKRSAAWLAASQNSDGGWGFSRGVASEADSTGAALQALAAAGGSRAAINRGVAYLRQAQLDGGGFSLAGGGSPNAQSTAWAVQGLVAAGSSPRTLRRGGRSPLDYLASVQAGDGHYRYSRVTDQTPVWVTGQGLQAAEQQAFPLREVAAPPSKSKGSSKSGGTAAPAPTPAAPSTGPGGLPRKFGGGLDKGTKLPPGAVPGAGDEKEPGVERYVEPPAEAEVDPASAATDEEDGDSDLPTYLAAALLVLVLAALGWLLRRQSARLAP
jgi:energy-coupling factor transport system substrate-specific component